MWWVLGLVLLCAYLALVAVVYLFQPSLIYFPVRELAATPAAHGLAYSDLQLTTADGITLHAWLVPASDPTSPIMLFCHGNGGNISHRLDTLALFHRLGLSTLIFDYRGYGRSAGVPSEGGTYLDAEAAWRYLVEKQRVDPMRIVLFGRSLGGAVAAWLAQDRDVCALILESAFTSVPDLGAELYPYLPVRWLSRFAYDTRRYLRRVRCPVLIVHSRDDEVVPFHHGRALFEAAHHPKKFLEIQGGHNQGFLLTGKPYEQGLAGFIARHLAGQAPARAARF